MAPPRIHQNPFAQSGTGNARLQYLPYSIFINGSHLSDEIIALRKVIRPFMPKNVDDWIHQQWKRVYYTPPPDDQPLVRDYEQRVRMVLDTIRTSEIGRCVFKSLNPNNAVWIVPYNGSQGVCNAITGQRGGQFPDDVSLQFSPETWDFGSCGQYAGYGTEDSLFHEMVHASRFSRLGYDGMNHEPLEQNKDHEEFLAVMITNSFMSEREATVFNRDYMTGKALSQTEVEEFLSSKRVLIEAIKYFLDDPMVQVVAKLPMPFNVFRDFQRLKDAYNHSPAGKADPVN